MDFGASDKPLAPADLAGHGLLQFPTVIVGITPVLYLPGVGPGQMHLTGPVLAQIYLGNIKRWTDPQIAPPQPRQALPEPADHRGASLRRVGNDLPLHLLPEGGQPGLGLQGRRERQRAVAGRPGRARAMTASRPSSSRRPGSIGYVEYAYAKNNNLAYADMADRDGGIVAPNEQSFTAAAAHANWDAASGFAPSLLNQPGAGAWPISGATFILVYKNPPKPAATGEVLKFFDWAYMNGDGMAAQLAYVPLPGNVKAMVRHAWATSVNSPYKPH